MSNSSQPHILQTKGLSVSFGGIKALDSVSFAIDKGSVTALIGPNGAGKTTVFNCLTGFYKANEGVLLFSGKGKSINISEVLGQPYRLNDFVNPVAFGKRTYYKMFGGTHQVARAGLARTFQNIRLFSDMTVVENLLVAQHNSSNKNLISGLLNLPTYKNVENKLIQNAYKWLEFMKLENFANRLAGELPYGHQRRLEIARAMCISPEMICLDEPAAGLNPNETKDLAELIIKLRNEFGVTVFVIEHDMGLVMNISDKIVVLNYGQVIAQGTPAEIRNNPVVLSAYLGTSE